MVMMHENTLEKLAQYHLIFIDIYVPAVISFDLYQIFAKNIF